MLDDRSDNYLPNPLEAGFYVRYVEVCRRAGIEPCPPQRVRELVGKWNATLRGEHSGRSDGADD